MKTIITLRYRRCNAMCSTTYPLWFSAL